MRLGRWLPGICLLLSMGANAQTISFVHDLNNMGSNYQILASVDFKGKLYFTTHSMYESGSLWQTDGTNNGTSLVYTWPKPVLGGLEFSPNLLTIFNNKLYFVSTDSAHGRELWTSDGTTTGTYLLKDIMPGSGSAFAPEYAGFGNGFRNNFCQLNNKLYFIASDISHNEEIWETDGTAAGTKQSFDLNGNNTSSLEYAPLAVSNGKLFFTGADGVYVSNGSLAGTSRIISGYNCFNPIPFGNKLCFNSTINNSQLVTDGTASGTIVISSNRQFRSDYVESNNKLYYVSTNQTPSILGAVLCVTDGTSSGTAIIKEGLKESSPGHIFGMDLLYPTLLNGDIYFCTDSAIWKTDGTNAGTVIVRNMHNYPFTTAYPSGLTAYNGKLYFNVFDSIRVELFSTDGTTTGTHKISMNGANYVGRYPNPYRSAQRDPMMMYNGQLYFTAFYDSTVGKSLYKMNVPAGLEPTLASGSSQLFVYPSPGTGEFTIRYPKGLNNAVVYDAAGRAVYGRKMNPSGKDILDLSDLSNGSYILKVTDSKESVSTPIVIVR